MNKFQKIARSATPTSFPTRLRRKRFKWLELMIADMNSSETINIIDFGGTHSYWNQVYDLENNPLNLDITLMNLRFPKERDSHFSYIEGDVRNLHDISDNSYAIGFSNSMLEHVGDITQQINAVNEIKRVASRIYLQTPNLGFFWEPHFNVPFIHWFATPFRLKLLSVMSRTTMKQQIENYGSNPVNLLSLSQLKYLFPHKEFNIYRERFYFFTKSFVVCTRQ